MSARIAGIVAAAILAILFVITVIGAAGPNDTVVPTNGVTAGGPMDNPGSLAALPELRDRAALQAWPGDTTRAASAAEMPSGEVSAPPAGRQLVEDWQANRAANSDILLAPSFLAGVATLPGNERNVLVQPQGRWWRSFRNNGVAYGGGLYVFGISLLIALFLAWRGRIGISEGESGETVERFSLFERANHWMTATSFLLMAITGLVILYGESLIRPWLGADAFSALADFSAWSHMTLAVPFVLGIIVMAVIWTRGNLPERLDWNWLKHGGGFLRTSGDNPPARRFNAGQKIVFWTVVLGGLGLLATGLFLMFPFYWTGYEGMQLAQVLHAALGLLMVGLIIGHIYIGTIGMRGAFEAMWSGQVDRNWAKEHHSLWYEQIAAGKGPPVRAKSERSPVSAVGSLAAGGAVAVVLALLISTVYREARVGSAVATSRDNPSVHLDPSDTRPGSGWRG